MNRLNILVVAACSLLLYTSKVQAKDGLSRETDGGVLSSLKKTKPSTDLLSDMPELVEVRIRHGDSLYELAKWSNTQIDIIESLNGVDTNDELTVGGGLLLPMTKTEQVEFKNKRSLSVESKRERYLLRHGGLSQLKSHRLKQGQTVWRIARESGGIPLWLVQSYNPEVDLNRVQVGQSIVIPVLGSTSNMTDPDSPIEPTDQMDVEGEFDDVDIDEEFGC